MGLKEPERDCKNQKGIERTRMGLKEPERD